MSFASTPTEALRALRSAISTSAVWPPSGSALGKLKVSPHVIGLLYPVFSTREQAIFVLDAVLDERKARQQETDRIELVWSGPEEGTTETRETAVVLRELFLGAKRSVLVATYVFSHGSSVFADLAAQMDADPHLHARVLLHAPVPDDGSDPRMSCISTFNNNWPGKRFPELWIDPRTLISSMKKKTTMHAKFAAVDDEAVFLTSANFTEAAQARNVEAGVLIRQPAFALRLRRHVDSLISHKLLERLR